MLGIAAVFREYFLDAAKAALELGVALAQGAFRVEARVARQIDAGEQQIADLIHDAVSIRAGVEFNAQRANLLVDLVDDRRDDRPGDADTGGAGL